MTSTKTDRIYVSLSKRTMDKLNAYANDLGITLSSAVNTLTNEGLDNWLIKQRDLQRDLSIRTLKHESECISNLDVRKLLVSTNFFKDLDYFMISGKTNSGKTDTASLLEITLIEMKKVAPTNCYFISDDITTYENFKKNKLYDDNLEKITDMKFDYFSYLYKIFAKSDKYEPKLIIIDTNFIIRYPDLQKLIELCKLNSALLVITANQNQSLDWFTCMIDEKSILLPKGNVGIFNLNEHDFTGNYKNILVE